MKSLSSTSPLLLRYGLSAIFSIVAIALTIMLDDPLTEPNTILLLLFAVVFSSWLGGFGPGLLATFITTLAMARFPLLSRTLFVSNSGVSSLRLFEYALVAISISFLNELRRKYEHRSQEAKAQAEAANRMKDEFIATISHELRTPLNAILGWIQIIRRKRDDQALLVKALETVERNARIQSQLIEDLIDVSRMGTGKIRLDIRQINLVTTIESAIDVVRPAINDKGIELNTAIGPEPCLINGDERRIQQVIWNLLSNAVKFTPEGGRIEILLENKNAQVRITVTDTGQGMEKEALPHVFERFWQATQSNTDRRSGLGLGLAITRELVELHGGRIRAESDGPGSGTKFVIQLPLS